MKKKYRRRKEYNLYLNNKKKIQEKGFVINDDILCYTNDYNFKTLIFETKIKDFKLSDLELNHKDDSFYYENQKNRYIYNEIRQIDFIDYSCWNVYNKKSDKLYNVYISTPYLRSFDSEFIDVEIMNLINKHYHYIYGYGKDFYIEPKLVKIKKGIYKNFYKIKDNSLKDSRDLIQEWVLNNKNSDIYSYYKSIIKEDNENNLKLNDIYFSNIRREINSLNIVIPYGCDLTYPELFMKIFDNKINQKEKFLEDSILEKLDYSLKDFLIQFKPVKDNIKTKKRIKRKGVLNK